MPVLVLLFVLCLSFYIYYKVKYVRSPYIMEKKYLSGKSSLALGLFIALFGVNELYLYHSVITILIAGIFIILGLLSVVSGYKTLRYYRSFAAEEIKKTKVQI